FRSNSTVYLPLPPRHCQPRSPPPKQTPRHIPADDKIVNMFRLDAGRAVRFCDGLKRRDFLHAGALATLGLSLSDWYALRAQSTPDVNCILLMLIGGPSQLDTFDMKPNAPVEIRGPYKPIKTNVPGIEISENFPRTAKHADKFSLIRSMYHTAAAVHDTGHQMMQTGRLFLGGIEHPHYGCVLNKLKGAKGDVPAHVLLPAHRQYRREHAARPERRLSRQRVRPV